MGIWNIIEVFRPAGITVEQLILKLRYSQSYNESWCEYNADSPELLFHIRLIIKYEDIITILEGLPKKLKCPRWVSQMIAMDELMAYALNPFFVSNFTPEDLKVLKRLRIGATVEN